MPCSHYFSFFAQSTSLTQTCLCFCSSLLLNMLKCFYAHTLYFDAAKFLIKLFSFIYFPVSVVRQQNEYEMVTKT